MSNNNNLNNKIAKINTIVCIVTERRLEKLTSQSVMNSLLTGLSKIPCTLLTKFRISWLYSLQ